MASVDDDDDDLAYKPVELGKVTEGIDKMLGSSRPHLLKKVADKLAAGEVDRLVGIIAELIKTEQAAEDRLNELLVPDIIVFDLQRQRVEQFSLTRNNEIETVQGHLAEITAAFDATQTAEPDYKRAQATVEKFAKLYKFKGF